MTFFPQRKGSPQYFGTEYVSEVRFLSNVRRQIIELLDDRTYEISIDPGPQNTFIVVFNIVT